MTLISYISLALLIALCYAKDEVDIFVGCNQSSMHIEIPRQGFQDVTLGPWHVFKECQPRITPNGFSFTLLLSPLPTCGVKKIDNKLTGKALYHNDVILHTKTGEKKMVKVSCPAGNLGTKDDNRIVKRNVLPAGFREPDYIEITKVVTNAAPVPELSVGVRQNGVLIGESVTVSAGAPLVMEVYLDNKSTEYYGIRVSYLMATDTTGKNETLIFNGCSLDPHVFENFRTTNGDFLEADFGAFKFPGSNYILFKGTVDVCLDSCQPIACSNGEQGYGRKRRDTFQTVDPNKVYEASMMTIIRVEDDGEAENVFRWLDNMVKAEIPSEERSLYEYREKVPFAFFSSGNALQTTTYLAILLATFLRIL